MGEIRPRRDGPRERHRGLFQHLGRVQGIPETPAFPLVGAHHPPGVEKFRRAPLPDQARQHRTGPHVTTRKPDTREQKGTFRLGRRQPYVRGHRKDRPGPHRHAIHRRNDRFAAKDHRLDQITRHPGKGQKLGHRAPDQGTDDVMHISAGTEVSAIRGEHHHIHIARESQRTKGVSQLGIAVKGQGVLAFGPRQADRGNAVAHTP